MIEAISKNLWLLLTIVIPGFCTYGVWRLLLLLEPGTTLDIDTMDGIDDSLIITSSIIIGIALSQQAFAIAIEAMLALVSKFNKERWPNFYSLFCERFELASAGKINESATRIIGNYFLSVNMSIGIVFLLFYFVAYSRMSIVDWIPIALITLLTATMITVVFRMLNAIWAIKACKKI